jgi:NAD(P)-dependent dehydrogenase (short-subunit alcohol dehydrogenase family)
MNSKPVAIITGASRGIGRSISTHLAAEGFDIVAVARTSDSECMLSLQPEIENRGAEFYPVGLDISATSHHDEAITSILDRYGRIDLLVNNAGVAPLERKDILDLEEESFDRVTDINLRGPVFFAQRVAREMVWMRKQMTVYNPAIIFITSVSAYMSSTNRLEYRLAEEGINVYEVRPGLIETDMTARVKDKFDKLIAEGLIPQKRWGTPEDVAKAVASLARGDWGFSTGTVFELSGGMNIKSL